MHEERNGQQESFSLRNAISPELNALFEQLHPQDVEQFYREYQLWTTQHRIAQLNAQVAELQQQRNQNAEYMQHVQPSPIALSVLAQLQAHGVEDIDLLDRMLERGEEWLDHTMDLLTRCEALDMIQGDYTRWCEHALEGAYDWIDSMTGAQARPEEPVTTDETTIEQTEALLLHKLMSDEETQPELASIVATPPPSENEAIQEHNLTAPGELSAPDEEEMQPEMGVVIEFALDERFVANEESIVDEPPAAEAEETTAVRGKITGPLQPKATGPLQPEEEETTSQAQDESEAVVADEVETITAPEDDTTMQILDEVEITTVTEDEAVAQTRDEPEIVAVPEDNPVPQMQPEDAEALQQLEDAEAASLLEDEAPIQAQDETAIEEHTSEEVSAEQPTETLAAIHNKSQVVSLDHIAEDQPQEEVTQPLDEHSTLELQDKEEQTEVNEDDHALPSIDEQQSPTSVSGQQPSSELLNGQSQLPEPANEPQQSEPINDQPQQPEPALTTTTTASYNKVFTTAPQTKKRRRSWFSWLFGRKS